MEIKGDNDTPHLKKGLQNPGLLDNLGTSLVAQTLKNPPQRRRPGVHPWLGKVPWRRGRLPTPVFWPGESHGQRSLEGHGPWGPRESDTTEPPSLTGQFNPEIGFRGEGTIQGDPPLVPPRSGDGAQL